MRPLVHPEAADPLGAEDLGQVGMEVVGQFGRTSVARGQHGLIFDPWVVFVTEDVEQSSFHATEHPIQ